MCKTEQGMEELFPEDLVWWQQIGWGLGRADASGMFYLTVGLKVASCLSSPP
jgi:hypothetical protein